MNTFERFRSRTLIQAFLEMESALAVGSRSSTEPTGTDLPVMKTPDGLPFIPGSSLKGVVRFCTERVLRSVGEENGNRFSACDPFDHPCVSRDKVEEIERELLEARIRESEKERERTRRIWEASCTVCRLFGSPWLAGRLAFKDSFLVNPEDLPVVTHVRDGVGIDRDLGAAREGIKYDFEAVIPGACFKVELVAENVEPWEIGLLLAVLRPWKEGHLALGGKTTRGLGWGRLKDITIRRVKAKDLLHYLFEGDAVMSSVEEAVFITAFRQKLEEHEGGPNHAQDAL